MTNETQTERKYGCGKIVKNIFGLSDLTTSVDNFRIFGSSSTNKILFIKPF